MSDGIIKRMVLDRLREAHEEEAAFVAGLTVAQRDAEGTPDHWSAKDRVAQIAAWKARQAGKLATAVRGDTPPRWTDSAVVDPLNAAIFAEYQSRPWSDVLAFADRAYATLVAQVEQLTEDDLANPGKYPAAGGALWPETLGNGIWFPFAMLADIAREGGEHDQLAHVTQARIQAYERMLLALESANEPPHSLAPIQYDLACVYALDGQPDLALQWLATALHARPEFAVHAANDGDFASLHGNARFAELTAAGRESPLATGAAIRERAAAGTSPLVIDVRGPDEFAAGHIDGAINIPLDQLSERTDEIPTESEVVTYCNMHHKGTSRSEQAALLLRLRGRSAAALDDGFPGWRSAGFPVAGPK